MSKGCTLIVTVDGLLQHEEKFGDVFAALAFAYSDQFRLRYQDWRNVEVFLVLDEGLVVESERISLWHTPWESDRWLARQRAVTELLQKQAKER